VTTTAAIDGSAIDGPDTTSSTIDVVGIGADGWQGLPGQVRRLLSGAATVLGSPRQLDLLPDDVAARRVPLPSPLLPGLADLLDRPNGPTVVLASGDPLWHGIGATLVRLLGAERVRVHPHPSSLSLACARLGWPVPEVTTVNVLTRPIELAAARLSPGRRLLVLGPGRGTVAEVARLLRGHGLGASRVIALSDLGAAEERVLEGTALDPPVAGSDLTVVAVHCHPDRPDDPMPEGSTTPGLPDDVYDHDGQLSKRDVRASALAHLRPRPGELLWDVGAGAGSVAIEWLRHHPSCRALAIERDPGRAERIARNAHRLGVPGLRVLPVAAPAGLAGLDRPDAVFVGGGVTAPGMLDAAWAALRPGGRLVAHAVTVESEAVLLAARAARGGELTRLRVEHLERLGSFSTWRPALAVTQWSVTRTDGDRARVTVQS
jgi:precorrin-6B C5,15-methyltransferase / cobalt-precorrin-6B C5,C15-methyltransferase